MYPKNAFLANMHLEQSSFVPGSSLLRLQEDEHRTSESRGRGQVFRTEKSSFLNSGTNSPPPRPDLSKKSLSLCQIADLNIWRHPITT